MKKYIIGPLFFLMVVITPITNPTVYEKRVKKMRIPVVEAISAMNRPVDYKLFIIILSIIPPKLSTISCKKNLQQLITLIQLILVAHISLSSTCSSFNAVELNVF
jgi:hypothetical protein